MTTAPQQAPADSAVYDSAWGASRTEIPSKEPAGLEGVMVADGKIYVVLAVVLVIWFGLVTLLLRTDRKLERLERQVEDDRSSSSGA